MSESQGNSSEGYKIGKGKPPIDSRWKPGQSGNPAGRPRKRRMEDELRKMFEDGVDGVDILAAMAKVAVKRSLKGDSKFWQMVVERVDGKVPDKIQSDGQIKVRVEYVKDNGDDADSPTAEASPDASEGEGGGEAV